MTEPPATLPLTQMNAAGLCYRRAGRTILDRVSLTLAAGESLAVFGPSGSGKSSLLALLAGLEEPDAGTVAREPPAARVGVVLQAYGLVGLLTAAENVEVALQRHVAAGTLTRADVRQRAAAALDAVGLAPVAGHLVEELSGGQQQRVAIARALVARPDILIADEISSELDHATAHQVLHLILAVAGRGGIVVLATHDPQVAERCDRTLHLVDGQAIAEPSRND